MANEKLEGRAVVTCRVCFRRERGQTEIIKAVGWKRVRLLECHLYYDDFSATCPDCERKRLEAK